MENNRKVVCYKLQNGSQKCIPSYSSTRTSTLLNNQNSDKVDEELYNQLLFSKSKFVNLKNIENNNERYEEVLPLLTKVFQESNGAIVDADDGSDLLKILSENSVEKIKSQMEKEYKQKTKTQRPVIKKVVVANKEKEKKQLEKQKDYEKKIKELNRKIKMKKIVVPQKRRPQRKLVDQQNDTKLTDASQGKAKKRIVKVVRGENKEQQRRIKRMQKKPRSELKKKKKASKHPKISFEEPKKRKIRQKRKAFKLKRKRNEKDKGKHFKIPRKHDTHASDEFQYKNAKKQRQPTVSLSTPPTYFSSADNSGLEQEDGWQFDANAAKFPPLRKQWSTQQKSQKRHRPHKLQKHKKDEGNFKKKFKKDKRLEPPRYEAESGREWGARQQDFQSEPHWFKHSHAMEKPKKSHKLAENGFKRRTKPMQGVKGTQDFFGSKKHKPAQQRSKLEFDAIQRPQRFHKATFPGQKSDNAFNAHQMGPRTPQRHFIQRPEHSQFVSGKNRGFNFNGSSMPQKLGASNFKKFPFSHKKERKEFPVVQSGGLIQEGRLPQTKPYSLNQNYPHEFSGLHKKEPLSWTNQGNAERLREQKRSPNENQMNHEKSKPLYPHDYPGNFPPSYNMRRPEPFKFDSATSQAGFSRDQSAKPNLRISDYYKPKKGHQGEFGFKQGGLSSPQSYDRPQSQSLYPPTHSPKLTDSVSGYGSKTPGHFGTQNQGLLTGPSRPNYQSSNSFGNFPRNKFTGKKPPDFNRPFPIDATKPNAAPSYRTRVEFDPFMSRKLPGNLDSYPEMPSLGMKQPKFGASSLYSPLSGSPPQSGSNLNTFGPLQSQFQFKSGQPNKSLNEPFVPSWEFKPQGPIAQPQSNLAAMATPFTLQNNISKPFTQQQPQYFNALGTHVTAPQQLNTQPILGKPKHENLNLLQNVPKKLEELVPPKPLQSLPLTYTANAPFSQSQYNKFPSSENFGDGHQALLNLKQKFAPLHQASHVFNINTPNTDFFTAKKPFVLQNQITMPAPKKNFNLVMGIKPSTVGNMPIAIPKQNFHQQLQIKPKVNQATVNPLTPVKKLSSSPIAAFPKPNNIQQTFYQIFLVQPSNNSTVQNGLPNLNIMPKNKPLENALVYPKWNLPQNTAVPLQIHQPLIPSNTQQSKAPIPAPKLQNEQALKSNAQLIGKSKDNNAPSFVKNQQHQQQLPFPSILPGAEMPLHPKKNASSEIAPDSSQPMKMDPALIELFSTIKKVFLHSPTENGGYSDSLQIPKQINNSPNIQPIDPLMVEFIKTLSMQKQPSSNIRAFGSKSNGDKCLSCDLLKNVKIPEILDQSYGKEEGKILYNSLLKVARENPFNTLSGHIKNLQKVIENFHRK